MQRQQTRWVVTGTAVAILAFASLAGPLSFGWNPHGVALLGLWTTVFVLLTLIPLSIASALLRSELWGVEPVVNRTLVYTLLAAILIGLYVSVVAAAGALFQRSFVSSLGRGGGSGAVSARTYRFAGAASTRFSTAVGTTPIASCRSSMNAQKCAYRVCKRAGKP